MKTLIVYASKHGTTAKCAKALMLLLGNGTSIHDLKTGPLPDLDGFDTVILGGPIYAGSLPANLRAFCQSQANVLASKRLGLFTCSMLGGEEGLSQLIHAFPERLSASAAAKSTFGGEFNTASMNLFERLIVKMVGNRMGPGASLDEAAIAFFAEAMKGR
jgi:menaquinone-dependent protoporphyrinogen oxidase